MRLAARHNPGKMNVLHRARQSVASREIAGRSGRNRVCIAKTNGSLNGHCGTYSYRANREIQVESGGINVGPGRELLPVSQAALSILGEVAVASAAVDRFGPLGV